MYLSHPCGDVVIHFNRPDEEYIFHTSILEGWMCTSAVFVCLSDPCGEVAVYFPSSITQVAGVFYCIRLMACVPPKDFKMLQ